MLSNWNVDYCTFGPVMNPLVVLVVLRLDGSSNPVCCLFRFLEFTFKKLNALPLVAIRIDEKVRDTYLLIYAGFP